MSLIVSSQLKINVYFLLFKYHLRVPLVVIMNVVRSQSVKYSFHHILTCMCKEKYSVSVQSFATSGDWSMVKVCSMILCLSVSSLNKCELL